MLPASVRVRGTSILALVAAASGCANDGGAGSGVGITVRDSAGIEIIEHALDDGELPVVFRLADSASVTIGQAEGEDAYLFSRVGAVVRLSDGHIVIAEPRLGELRWFDARGRHVRTVGRRGAGPGEFRHIGMVARGLGDTLIVEDMSNSRLTFIAPGGDIVRSVSTTLLRELADRRRISFFDVLPDGRLSGTTVTLRRGPPSKGLFLDSNVVWVVGRDADSADSIATLYRSQSMIREVHAMESGSFEYSSDEIPFSPRGTLAVSGDALYYASGRSYEISKLAADGRVVRLIRLTRRTRMVTDSLTRAYRSRVLEGTPANRRAETERSLRELRFPDSLPAFSNVRVDAAHRLWAREFSADPEEPSRWLVFDTDDRLLGAASLHADCIPVEIGADNVLCLTRDELDVERVELRSLMRVNDWRLSRPAWRYAAPHPGNIAACFTHLANCFSSSSSPS